MSRTRSRALPFACALLAVLLLAWPPSSAHAQVFAEALRTKGLAPDLQLQGGAGFGLRREIDNNFLARLRAGFLYAYEPWIVNLGPIVELGGLAGFGIGGQLELNSFGGAYAQLGFSRVSDDAFMTHLGAGFTIFGLEWEHRIAKGQDDDALLLSVRVPLGIWWFLVHHDDDKQKSARATSMFAQKPENERAAKPAPPGPSDDDRLRAQKALERAREESEKGNHALAAEAYAHAYELEQDPMILPLLVDARLAYGAQVAAARELHRFLDTTSAVANPPAELRAARARAQARLDELSARIPQLRLSWSSPPPSDTRVTVDGQAVPGTLLGYDVPVDPGTHELAVAHGAAEWRRTFEAKERQVVRLTVSAEAAPPAAASEPPPPPPAATEPAPSEARHD